MPKMYHPQGHFLVIYCRLAVLFTLLNRGQSHFFSLASYQYQDFGLCMFRHMECSHDLIFSAVRRIQSNIVCSLSRVACTLYMTQFTTAKIKKVPFKFLFLSHVPIQSLLLQHQAVATVCVCARARMRVCVQCL